MEEPQNAKIEPVQPYFEDSTSTPAPPQKSNKMLLLAGAAVILLCCLCLALVGGYFAVSNFFESKTTLEPTEIIDMPQPEPKPLVTSLPATPKPPAAGDGLGVSRAEMMDFFGSGEAFNFDTPTIMQGMEVVMGTHTRLCLKGDCAAVTLLGPEESLSAVSAAVPTDPNDSSQTMTSAALLMTLASRFVGSSSTVPTDILNALLDAQSSGQSSYLTFKDNGYTFDFSYDAGSGVAALAVTQK